MTARNKQALPVMLPPLPRRFPQGPLRVVLIGAESTGKTTLAEQLAEHYHAPWIPEYVREFVESAGTVKADDVEAIARGFLEREAAAWQHAKRLLIYDTDLLSVCIYSRYYFGSCPSWIEQAAQDRLADLYLLAGDEIPWVPDPGQREGPEVRATLQLLFCEALSTVGAPSVLVSGTLETRLATAITAIDQQLTLRNKPHNDDISVDSPA